VVKDDDEHYRIEVALAGFSSGDINLKTEKGVLTIEAAKDDVEGNYIHRGIAQRAFSKMFRLAEYMKVEDAQFVDGILTVFVFREVPEADKPKQININTKPKRLNIKAA
jgi:molecular chaperone IbpA